MINVYLCEDEEMQLDFIRCMLETGIAERKIDATIISARKSPRDTLLDAKSRRNEKSLFVIDIQLNDFSMNGIDLARELKEISDEFHFVFLTSEYAAIRGERITTSNMVYMVDVMSECIIKNEVPFCELDAHAGDGDFGMSVAKGFLRLKQEWDTVVEKKSI